MVQATTGETIYFLTRKYTLKICQKKNSPHFKIQKECRVPAAHKRPENTTVLSILDISYFSHYVNLGKKTLSVDFSNKL